MTTVTLTKAETFYRQITTSKMTLYKTTVKIIVVVVVKAISIIRAIIIMIIKTIIKTKKVYCPLKIQSTKANKRSNFR